MNTIPTLKSSKLQVVNMIASFIFLLTLFNFSFTEFWRDYVLIMYFTHSLYALILTPFMIIFMRYLPDALMQIMHKQKIGIDLVKVVVILLSPFILYGFNPTNLSFVSPAIATFLLIWSLLILLIVKPQENNTDDVKVKVKHSDIVLENHSDKSFFTKLGIAIFLLFLFVVPGIIALVVFAEEAKQTPNARGAKAIIWFNRGVFISLIILLGIWATRSFIIWNSLI